MKSSIESSTIVKTAPVKGTGLKGTGFRPYIQRSPTAPALGPEGAPLRPLEARGALLIENAFHPLNGRIEKSPSGAKAPALCTGLMYGLKPVPFIGVKIFKALLASGILAGFLAPTVLIAQRDKPWEKIPVPKLHEFKPQEPKRIELKNGIVIFLEEDHELPFVSGSVLIPGGSRDESAAKTGLVGLYGQAWRTSGTAKMDGDALDDLLEAKAAHIETGGDEDSTAVSWDSLKGDADKVFSLALDLLLNPKFSQ